MRSKSIDPISPDVAQPHVQAKLYEAGCALEQLSSLFASITDQLDDAYDARRAGQAASSLARLGFDSIDATLKKLLGAESACSNCWKGRLAIAQALAAAP